jgi:hypothetical protein
MLTDGLIRKRVMEQDAGISFRKMPPFDRGRDDVD